MSTQKSHLESFCQMFMICLLSANRNGIDTSSNEMGGIRVLQERCHREIVKVWIVWDDRTGLGLIDTLPDGIQ